MFVRLVIVFFLFSPVSALPVKNKFHLVNMLCINMWIKCNLNGWASSWVPIRWFSIYLNENFTSLSLSVSLRARACIHRFSRKLYVLHTWTFFSLDNNLMHGTWVNRLDGTYYMYSKIAAQPYKICKEINFNGKVIIIIVRNNYTSISLDFRVENLSGRKWSSTQTRALTHVCHSSVCMYGVHCTPLICICIHYYFRYILYMGSPEYTNMKIFILFFNLIIKYVPLHWWSCLI